jgi:thiol peroxidase
MDLPFAQSRFCGDNKITSLKNLSDTHDQSFGKAYGVLIDGLAIPLLARAVFVVDASGTIKHAEYVSEVANEPNYDAALKALKACS